LYNHHDDEEEEEEAEEVDTCELAKTKDCEQDVVAIVTIICCGRCPKNKIKKRQKFAP
jgi:hypothetical protein